MGTKKRNNKENSLYSILSKIKNISSAEQAASIFGRIMLFLKIADNKANIKMEYNMVFKNKVEGPYFFKDSKKDLKYRLSTDCTNKQMRNFVNRKTNDYSETDKDSNNNIRRIIAEKLACSINTNSKTIDKIEKLKDLLKDNFKDTKDKLLISNLITAFRTEENNSIEEITKDKSDELRKYALSLNTMKEYILSFDDLYTKLAWIILVSFFPHMPQNPKKDYLISTIYPALGLETANIDKKEVVELLNLLKTKNTVSVSEIELNNINSFSNIINNDKKNEGCSVPSKLSIFELYGYDSAQIQNDRICNDILNNWNAFTDEKNIKNLSAPIGKNEHGNINLDLYHTRAPNMLVTGMPGSGKTETVITYLIGLCMKYPPSAFNFMIVDNGELSNRLRSLPHCVGIVSNTTYMEEAISTTRNLNRLFESINAEIKRRYILFSELGVCTIESYNKAVSKMQNFIDNEKNDDLNNILNKKHLERLGKTPRSFKSLPHIVLVINDVYKLKKFSSLENNADFITELAEIMNVARTIGFHIILIADYFESVISEVIKSTSNARICFKVTIERISKEMLKTSVAAAPTMPNSGWAYLYLESNSRYEYFQSAYTGDYFNVDISPVIKTSCYFTSESNNTQLGYIVKCITNVSENFERPVQIIPPPLPRVINDVTEWEENKKITDNMICTLGAFDIPVIQRKILFNVDLLETNIMLFGLPKSGKTSFLKNLINILHKKYDENCEQIFILDFDGSLSEYHSMPLVSMYCDNTKEEDVKRVFSIIECKLYENKIILGRKKYRETKDMERPIHTTVIIENINVFINEQRYSLYHEKFASISRDSVANGISIVATASETRGTEFFLDNFRQKIAYTMIDDKYYEIFMFKPSIVDSNAGHGFANITVKPEDITNDLKMNLPYEIQTSKPESINDINSCFLKNLKNKFGYNETDMEYLHHVKRYKPLPQELTIDNFYLFADTKYIGKSTLSVNIGIDYRDLEPVFINFERNHVVSIYGKKEFGKTNLLKLLVKGIAKKNASSRFVFFDDGRNELIDIYSEISLTHDTVIINQTKTVGLERKDGTTVIKKLSPIQQFYIYLNGKYTELPKRFLAPYYDLNDTLKNDYERVPDCVSDKNPLTIFVIQSNQVYLNSMECKRFIINILPQMAAEAFEKGYIFIFSDVQAIVDGEQNVFFNNLITSSFLLDNIAEFASERGKRTIFGNMDVNYLKNEYAICELGDGYYYDVEANMLKKIKLIKNS